MKLTYVRLCEVLTVMAVLLPLTLVLATDGPSGAAESEERLRLVPEFAVLPAETSSTADAEEPAELEVTENVQPTRSDSLASPSEHLVDLRPTAESTHPQEERAPAQARPSRDEVQATTVERDEAEPPAESPAAEAAVDRPLDAPQVERPGHVDHEQDRPEADTTSGERGALITLEGETQVLLEFGSEAPSDLRSNVFCWTHDGTRLEVQPGRVVPRRELDSRWAEGIWLEEPTPARVGQRHPDARCGRYMATALHQHVLARQGLGGTHRGLVRRSGEVEWIVDQLEGGSPHE